MFAPSIQFDLQGHPELYLANNHHPYEKRKDDFPPFVHPHLESVSAIMKSDYRSILVSVFKASASSL